MSGALSAPAPSAPLRRALCDLCVAMARRDERTIAAHLETLVGLVGEAPDPAGAQTAVEEAILQTLLFLGFPAALTALATWRELCEVAGEIPAHTAQAEAPRDDGEAVCRAVYGGAYEKLRGRMEALHPAVNQWMVDDGYGKVMGRSGLDLGTRELLNLSLLAATDFPEQLHSHLRGALRVGVSAEHIEAALEGALEGLPPARQDALRARWRALQARAKEGRGD